MTGIDVRFFGDCRIDSQTCSKLSGGRVLVASDFIFQGSFGMVATTGGGVFSMGVRGTSGGDVDSNNQAKVPVGKISILPFSIFL
ncbi:MAG: hypothetical protein CO118_03610 [Flavobacteriales bacterium CG_4_9_14_3_um_filter_32_8]|nr:MAG: hypothetical protein CO118_03610 [Flavobacteriales bacterium CG_4_9_14_3_um_filter_32_8]